ncbi:MAG: T9SS type A sorting domain-containing protein [Bacteroidia bacterium]|nr:T9SS type A sorting domain-containing protein [Bacteroidia bacterium]
MKKLIVLSMFSLTLASESGFAQLKYYEDSFNGGVTSGGYSPAYNAGGTGVFTLNIAAGSTIRTAYLIAGRHGNPVNLTVTLNGTNYTFNSANQVSPTFQSPSYGGNSGVHLINVTAGIDPAVNNYNLIIPAQTGPSNRYNDFVLYVAFNNPGMTIVNTAVFINTLNFGATLNYSLNFTNPINTSYPVAVSLMTGFICDASTDGEKVDVGTSLLGTIGNHDVNSGTCGGPIGSFVYTNNTLTGLSDDVGNVSVAAADALSDIRTKISNNATAFTMKLYTVSAGNATNAIWAVFVTSGSSTPLPVELTQFIGTADHGINHLSWTTASETNCDYFDVEKSHNGSTFSTFGSVQGAGNSTATSYYTFNDENPFSGFTYYRLKQTDYDGNYHYSNVINLSNSSYTVSSIDVYTLQGQLVASVNAEDHLSLNNLTSGVYLLYYHTSKGVIVKKAMCQPNQEPVVVN